MKKALSVALTILVGLFVLNSLVLAGDGKNHKVIKIDGMMCAACEAKVKDALLKVDGVESAEVSAKTGEARIALASDKVDLKALKTAVDKAGFKPVSFDGKSACELGICDCCSGEKGKADKMHKDKSKKGTK